METKICQNCEKDFVIEPEDFAFYEKIKVPPPTWCPECRMVRRMIWRNERALYKRKCDATGKDIISMYPEDKVFPVFDVKYWWSDNWDPMEYGQDYDFSKPFFEQFKELNNKIPKQCLYQKNCIDSPWVNRESDSKNCYFNLGGVKNEDSAYNTYALWNNNVFDNYVILKSELSYNNFIVRNCYKIFFSKFCFNCQEVYFSESCFNCSCLIGCVNLRNKNYYVFNKPVTKEKFNQIINKLGSFSFLTDLEQDFKELKLKSIYKYASIKNSIECIGDNIENSKKCINCFSAEEIQNSKFIVVGGYLQDCYDCFSVGVNNQLCYEFSEGGSNTYNIFFSRAIENSFNIFYSQDIWGSNHLFGCAGLRHKQYCILNKQYTKEEYEKLVPKIIKNMDSMPYVDRNGRIYKYGEFFPAELSPFGYNEITAQEYFPLAKEQAIKQGYSWKDPEERDYQIDIKTEDLPDHIKDVSNSIIGKVIQCQHAKFGGGRPSTKCNEQCTTAFKIIEPELQFYKRMNLPLPRLCPNCRHCQRLKQRNPLKLWKRKCMCAGSFSQPTTNNRQQPDYRYQNTTKHFHGDQPCLNEFETTYSPDKPEIVYCEKCYQTEVV